MAAISAATRNQKKMSVVHLVRANEWKDRLARQGQVQPHGLLEILQELP
jgi:hypothetical protein